MIPLLLLAALTPAPQFVPVPNARAQDVQIVPVPLARDGDVQFVPAALPLAPLHTVCAEATCQDRRLPDVQCSRGVGPLWQARKGADGLWYCGEGPPG